jgi:hypothetical protein
MRHYLRRSLDPREQYRRWIDPRLRSLRVANVVAYLEGHGWKPLPPDRPALRAFQEPTGATVDGRPLCQFVPDSEADDNYAQLMFELITGLAEYEDRQAREVIDDIQQQAGRDPANGPMARPTCEVAGSGSSSV